MSVFLGKQLHMRGNKQPRGELMFRFMGSTGRAYPGGRFRTHFSLRAAKECFYSAVDVPGSNS